MAGNTQNNYGASITPSTSAKAAQHQEAFSAARGSGQMARDEVLSGCRLLPIGEGPCAGTGVKSALSHRGRGHIPDWQDSALPREGRAN